MPKIKSARTKVKQTLKDWLMAEPFTLSLSSSFFGFFAHAGLVAALEERGIEPKKITGSSAGALVGAAVASGLSVQALRELLFSLQKRDFWDPGFGAGLLKGEKFYSLLEKNLAPTFEDTKFPVEIAVFDLISLRTKFIGDGSLPKAVLASCAVPLMFQPVRINSRLYLDGGLFLKSGMNLADPNERILCAFFESPGLMGLYERKTNVRGIGSNQKFLRFKKLPQVGPNSLGNGLAAYAEGYRRTKASLNLPIGERFSLEVKE